MGRRSLGNFTSRTRAEHISARLIVRRVKRLNPTSVPAGQDELFSVSRHHAVSTDSHRAMLAAEATHRDHAIVEKVIAVPARIARSARRLRLHLPQQWPGENPWQGMLTAANGPPISAT